MAEIRPISKEGRKLQLTKVSMEELSLEDTLLYLLEGKTILVSSYLKNSKKDDLLVKLEGKDAKLTGVTRPKSTMQGFMQGSRFWNTFDISINQLSLNPTYVFDEGRYLANNKYEVTDIVSYSSDDGVRDVAIIEEVFLDEKENIFYYELSREEERLFEEDELNIFEE